MKTRLTCPVPSFWKTTPSRSVPRTTRTSLSSARTKTIRTCGRPDTHTVPPTRTGRDGDSAGRWVATTTPSACSLCVDGAPVGFVRLIREHPWVHVTRDAELGYWITPDEWRNGYATAAAECMVEYGFSELGLHRITASALTTNEASKRVLKRVGFVEEGVSRDASFVDGEWCDMVRYGLLREERYRP